MRTAALRSMRRQLISNQTIEPTQIVGFNQLFDDLNGAISKRYAGGVDQKITDSFTVGGEATSREISVPLFLGDQISNFDWKEKTERVYAYWWISGSKSKGRQYGDWASALSVEYQRERFDRPVDDTGNEGIVRLDTRFVPLGFAIFPTLGLSFRITTTYVRQEGQLQVAPSTDQIPISSRFWLTDVVAKYQLPNRHMSMAFGIANLFNVQRNYIEIDPLNPRIAPGRFVFGNVRLQF